MQTTYEKQAQDFLDRFGIKFRATLSDSKLPPWSDSEHSLCGAKAEKSRHHYRCTLSKSGVLPDMHANHVTRQNRGKMIGRPAARLTFDFWGSIADAEAGNVTVSAYDVLACISGDVHTPETFEDFCGEYGYDQDSIKALQQFRRCSAFAKRLREFFTAEELEALSKIQ